MNITLYKNNAEKNRMYKNNFLGENHEFTNCTLKAPTSFTNPIIVLYETNYITQNQYNYAYIPEFKRYYFVTDIICISKNMWEIHMHVDVLMSWKEKIVTNKALILRSSDKGSPYLRDRVNCITQGFTIEKSNNLSPFFSDVVDYNGHRSLRNIILFVRNDSLTEQAQSPTNRGSMLQSPATGCSIPFFGGMIYIIDAVYLNLIVANNGSNSNIMSSIIKAIAFPFDVVRYFSSLGTILPTQKGIHLTDFENNTEVVESETDDIYYIPYFSETLTQMSIDSDIIPSTFFENNYLDYEPFSEYYVHLASCGDVKINVDDLKKNFVKLNMVFDIWNGIITYSIFVSDTDTSAYGSKKCVLCEQTMAGSQLVISFDNADLLTKDFNNNNIKNISTALLSLASGFAGAAMMAIPGMQGLGIGLMTAGISGGISGVVGAATPLINPDSSASGASGNSNGIYSTYIDYGIYLYHKKYNTMYKYDNNDYVSIIGRPANTVVTISECHGYLEVGTCHLDNVPALSDELDEITQLLQQGILMPDN